MRIGLLGGTFDPPHHGHLRLAEAARRQCKLDRVYLVLSPRSPFKLKFRLSPVSQRKKWLSAALRGKKNLRLGAWELSRKGPTYTVLTLRLLRKRYPRWDLFLILGSDSFKWLPKWKCPEEIARLSHLVVGRRPGTTHIKIPSRWKNRTRVLRGVFPNISSTQIRALLQRNPALAKKFMPHPVASLFKIRP